MPENKRVTCPAGVYTALSNGEDAVNFTPKLIYGGRMAFAASQPSPDITDDYRSVEGGTPVGLTGMSGTNVWWRPNEVDEVIEVTRG